MTFQQLYQETTQLIQSGQVEAAINKLHHQLETSPDDEITLSILGSALMRKNDFQNAFTIFEKAVHYHPSSYAAQADLAFAHMKSGNNKQAIITFEKATSLNPDFYQAWCFLGKLHFVEGAYNSALSALEKSRKTDPFSAEYQNIQSALTASNFAEAEQIARNILSKQPGHAKASYALARLATSVGAHEESAKILYYALEHFPADIILRTALVHSLEEVGAYEKAAKEAKLITTLKADDASNWQLLGRIYSHCGEYEKALSTYERALNCTGLSDQERGNIQLLRGHMLKIKGHREATIEAYKDSIQTIKENGAGWWALADMKTYKFSDNDRKVMKNLYDDRDMASSQRTQAAFALGKSYEDEGNFPKAFEFYKKANDLRPDVNFKPETFKSICDETRKFYTNDILSRQAPLPEDGPTPIFIVGLPRAGSTLIEQILSSHSQIEGTMELVNLPNLARRIRIEGGQYKLPYPQSLSKFTANELARFGQAYLDETALYRTDKPYFIDKLPTNFERVGLIHMILPHAIIIDARRHPLDGGFSCYKQHFAGGHEFSYDLEHIGHYYNSYLDIMDHWDSVLPNKVKCVQYENMIENTEAEITELLGHCGLEVEEACFEFHKNKRAVRTASSEQVRQPIYRKSKGVWQNYEQELQPMKDVLGAATLARFKDYSGLEGQ